MNPHHSEGDTDSELRSNEQRRSESRPSESRRDELKVGDTLEVVIERMAHGGEGIATAPDGRVIFVLGAFPGDRVEVGIGKLKRSFARGHVTAVLESGPYRGPSRCPAAEAGAGCCDFAEVNPEKEVELKTAVLRDQLRRLAGIDELESFKAIALAPHTGWRTRVRLGVDGQGRAGTRKRGSTELVTDTACSQLVDGLVEGIVGPGARRFTPGAEVIAVIDSQGKRHVVETRRAPRGRRVEMIREVIEGSGEVTESAGDHQFVFPATAFWQAHCLAPDSYSQLVKEAISFAPDLSAPYRRQVGWDLYGGVGVFIPSIAKALKGNPKIISVDYSPAATATDQADLAGFDVEVKTAKVEKVIGQLPRPDVVVLDPPRTGAGDEVVTAVAQAGPTRVAHVGCDPATFARDLKSWLDSGYKVSKLVLIDSFPGTHHFEAIATLAPSAAGGHSAVGGHGAAAG